MEEARKDLARFGEPVASAVPAESRTQPDTQEPSGGFGFFGRLLTKSEKTPRVQKPTTAEGIIIGAPQADSAEIAENISRIREAGLTDLESAIDAVWSATMSRQKRETPEQDAEEAVEALNGQKEWNWQVWSMLGLAHQQRAALHGQMNKLAEASEDLSASRAYFAAARKARPDVFRSTVSN